MIYKLSGSQQERLFSLPGQPITEKSLEVDFCSPGHQKSTVLGKGPSFRFSFFLYNIQMSPKNPPAFLVSNLGQFPAAGSLNFTENVKPQKVRASESGRLDAQGLAAWARAGHEPLFVQHKRTSCPYESNAYRPFPQNPRVGCLMKDF